jgi:CRP/FNR family cyclic AMP-dependent transcriptional regulator
VKFEKDEVIYREGYVSQEFCLLTAGLIAIEIVNPHQAFRVQTLSAGDEFGWSALLDGHGTLFQSRALEPSTAITFDTPGLKAACVSQPAFGFALMQRILGVVSERLQATRLQLLDMVSPAAHRGGM